MTQLGEAVGVIRIDLSSLEAAAEVVRRVSQTMADDMRSVGEAGVTDGGMRKTIQRSIQDVRQASEAAVREARKAAEQAAGAGGGLIKLIREEETNAAVASLRLEMSQIQTEEQERIRLIERQTVAQRRQGETLQAQKNTIGAINNELRQTERMRGGAIRTPISDLTENNILERTGPRTEDAYSLRFPTFIQFSLYPAAGIAEQLGAQEASQAIFGIANMLGIADSINPMVVAAERLAQRLSENTDIFSQFATAAGALALPMGTTAAAITSALVAALPFAAAIGGVALVLNEIRRRAEETAAASERYNAVMERRALLEDMIQEGAAHAETIERMTELQTEYDALSAQIAALSELRAAYEALSGDAVSPTDFLGHELNVVREGLLGIVSDVGLLGRPLDEIPGAEYSRRVEELNRMTEEATGGAARNVQELSVILENLSTQAQEAGLRATEFGRGLIDPAVSARITQNEALIQQEEQRTRANETYRIELEAQIRASAMTVENLAQYRASLEEQKQILESVLLSVDRSSPVYQEFAERVSDLEAQLRGVAAATGRIDISSAQKAVQAVGQTISSFLASAVAFNRERARTLEDRSILSEREAEDFWLGRLNRIEAFNRDLEHADEEFARQRAERTEDFNRETQEQEARVRDDRQRLIERFNQNEIRQQEDYQTRISRIQRDARITQLESAARLDARAIFENQRQTSIRLSDEAEDFARARQRRSEDFELRLSEIDDANRQQRDRRKEEFERQLSDQEAQHERQRQRRIEDFNRQLALDAAERQNRLRRQAEDHALQDARRTSDFLREQHQRIAHNSALQGIVAAGLNVIQFLWHAALTNMSAAAAAFHRSTVSGVPGGISGPGHRIIERYQTGTSRVPATGVYMLEAGEAVLTPEVAAYFRKTLGSNFTQEAAAAAVSARGTAVNVGSIQVSIGNVGSHSPQQIQTLVTEAIVDALETIAQSPRQAWNS